MVTQKGMPTGSETNNCNTLPTRYRRAVAPRVRERIKNDAPVLCAVTPKR